MNLEIVGRHIDITPSLKEFTEERVKKLTRLLDGPLDVHVVLGTEKRRQLAEILVKSKHGNFNGTETSEDLYASIREVADKIEKQIRRHKRKLTDHKHRRGPRDPEIAAKISANAAEEAANASPQPRSFPIDGTSRLLHESVQEVPLLTAEDAAIRIDLEGRSAMMFRDPATEELQVVSRRSDGNFDWIRTGDSIIAG